MKNLHINDSYNIWSTKKMDRRIRYTALKEYESRNPEVLLDRSYTSMHIEWWLHNIGYYLTKPFCSIKIAKDINLRCKDVDLEQKVYEV